MRATGPTHLNLLDIINLKFFETCKALKSSLQIVSVFLLFPSLIQMCLWASYSENPQFVSLRHWEDEDSVVRLYT